MNKEICFKIDSKELFLEQILVEYENVPMLFICTDNDQEYYTVLCADIDEERYIIVKTTVEKIISLFTQELTMRDLIHFEKSYWEISAGDTIELDHCKQHDMDLINLDDLPYENSYFKVVTASHKEFLTALENLLFSREDEWVKTIPYFSTNELDSIVSIANLSINEYVEIKSYTKIESILHNALPYISPCLGSFVNIRAKNKSYTATDLNSESISTGNNSLTAA